MYDSALREGKEDETRHLSPNGQCITMNVHSDTFRLFGGQFQLKGGGQRRSETPASLDGDIWLTVIYNRERATGYVFGDQRSLPTVKTHGSMGMWIDVCCVKSQPSKTSSRKGSAPPKQLVLLKETKCCQGYLSISFYNSLRPVSMNIYRVYICWESSEP
jgi:hypothetical protein